MVAMRIEHLGPLLQITMIASAPGYALRAFVLNCRTDHAEVLTSTHGMQVRTNAFWHTCTELLVYFLGTVPGFDYGTVPAFVIRRAVGTD